MELLLRARGLEITEHLRRVCDHKVAKLARLDPRATRIEIELISERNPRQNGAKRVEAALFADRHTLRARAHASEVEAAIDVLVQRLERQIRDIRTTRKNRGAGNGPSRRIARNRGG